MKYEEKKALLEAELKPLAEDIDNKLQSLLLKVYDMGRRDAFKEMEDIATAINEMKKAEANERS